MNELCKFAENLENEVGVEEMIARVCAMSNDEVMNIYFSEYEI